MTGRTFEHAFNSRMFPGQSYCKSASGSLSLGLLDIR